MGMWIETFPIDIVPLSKRAVTRASFVAADEFQAATFNALSWFLSNRCGFLA
jgi:hypothetical protein